MPTGRENEATIGARIARVEIKGAGNARWVREAATQLTSDLIARFARSDRFAPAQGSLREGLEVTVEVREVEMESGGRRPYGAARIVAEAEKISGGRVAEMSEKVKCDLDKDREMERQFADALAAAATPFFTKFVRECDKRY